MADRILVIEDERLLSHAMVEKLQGAHYAAVPAGSSSEGLRHLQTNAFDLVILVLKLPDGEGLEMLPQIRAAFPELKVLVLIKPIQPDQVLKLLPSLLNPRYQRRTAVSNRPQPSPRRVRFPQHSFAD